MSALTKGPPVFRLRFRLMFCAVVIAITAFSFLVRPDRTTDVGQTPGSWQHSTVENLTIVAMLDSGTLIAAGVEITLVPINGDRTALLTLDSPVDLVVAAGSYYAVSRRGGIEVYRWPRELLHIIPISEGRVATMSLSPTGSLGVAALGPGLTTSVTLFSQGDIKYSTELLGHAPLCLEMTDDEELWLSTISDTTDHRYKVFRLAACGQIALEVDIDEPVYLIAAETSGKQAAAVSADKLYMIGASGITWTAELPRMHPWSVAIADDGAAVLALDQTSDHAVLLRYQTPGKREWDAIIGGYPGAVAVDPEHGYIVITSLRIAAFSWGGLPAWDHQLPDGDRHGTQSVVIAGATPHGGFIVLTQNELWQYTIGREAQ